MNGYLEIFNNRNNWKLHEQMFHFALEMSLMRLTYSTLVMLHWSYQGLRYN